MIVRRTLTAVAVAGSLVLASPHAPALAWGSAGHHLISHAGAETLPDTLPAFVRTPQAVGDIEALGTEADRDKQVGDGFNDDFDPGHYLDLGDDGKIGGVVALTALPPSRKAYDAALEPASNQYAAGYLPYEMIEGWKRVVLDFSIWRTDRAGAGSAPVVGERFAFATDMRRREDVTIRDIGYWSHFMGDASQPLHVSVHYNGWGAYPNPAGYSTAHTVHAHFEGEYVRANVTLAAVEKAMTPLLECGCSIQTHVAQYLAATNAQVVPFYTLEKGGAFASATPAGVEFATDRVADGASALRDFIVEAYDASATSEVGYPDAHTVDEYERGRAVPVLRSVLGSD